ncbi:hypothetical protein F443_01062 [Plasmopara halstedii]|uniref:Autophagy protein ATG17-like domain-containing protein n=1 Tax=Plasmopara halstedii TaxID=4781 RepID=A0A0P1AWQ6_PLAHL|nr:hypothetical protein F443_01062 [Plasmopara halstedii]CEG45710.1 hypothetical protein F443_01062 [Plasmopara halstedii]|eukprot:XP_024582079.1 hypothetical protein F443_01062 [Plasmopara halstedii]
MEYCVNATREVTKTISEKCHVLNKMLKASRVKLHSAQKIAHDSVFVQMPLLQEMNRVFEQLQSTTVDPGMVADEQDKTLYDFIDAETVRSLQQDAFEQTKEIEELLTTHQHAIARIAIIYDFFTTFEKTHETDLKALSGDYRELALINDDKIKSIEEFYTIAVSFFVDMEQCDRFLLQYFSTINDIYPHYEMIFADVHLLFEELRSLRDFYLQFLASYQSVGIEMQRRKQYETKVRHFIEETQAKLALLEQDEFVLRSTFCAEHGRYLPSTLCPEIHDAPDKYTVVHDGNSKSKIDRKETQSAETA